MATTYVEPGTYVSEEEPAVRNPADATVKMYPLFVGRIPQKLPVTKTIVRSDSEKIGESTKYDVIDGTYSNNFTIVSIKNAYNSAKSYSHDEKGDKVFLEVVTDSATGKIGLDWKEYVKTTTVNNYQRYILCETRPNNLTTGDYYVIVNSSGEIVDTEATFDGESTYKFRQIITGDIIGYGVPIYRDAVAPRIVKEVSSKYVAASAGDVATTTPSVVEITGTATTDDDGRKINETKNFLSVTETSAAKDAAQEGFVPAIGTPYKIQFTFSPAEDSEYFTLQEWEKSTDVAAFYGADTESVDYTEEGIGYNPLPTAAKIANEIGSKHFLTLGVNVPVPIMSKDRSGARDGYSIKTNKGIVFAKDLSGRYRVVGKPSVDAIDDGDFIPTDGSPCVIDADATYAEAYRHALDNQCEDINIEKAYRIIPLDQGPQIGSALKNHVVDFSSEDERLECGGFYSLPYSDSSYISYADYLNQVTASATSMASARMVTSYGRGTRTLSNGVSVALNTQYLFCAAAALEQLIMNGTSLTNTTIPLSVFSSLDTPAIRRTVKNEIASSGVMIFEQRPSTAAIKIRHALTTLYANKYGKEMSVQRDVDFVKKYLRGICNPYIGRSNVDDTTIELVRETVVTGLETLSNSGWITEGNISSIAVDEDSPDTILITIRIKVPFPLNYIYITLVLDN